MSDKTLISRLPHLSDEQLEAELASHEHNDIGRHVILQEKTSRAIVKAARPNWIIVTTLILTALAAIFAGISAVPIVQSWLSGR